METEKQKIGKIGEDLACDFLLKKGFKINLRNYRQKWGEIDIIAEKNNKTHFIEVKTIKSGELMPEDQLTLFKRKKMAKTGMAFANKKNLDNWQIDAIAIEIKFNDCFEIRHWENLEF